MARWTRLLEAVAVVQLPGPTGASFTSGKKLACGAPRHSRNIDGEHVPHNLAKFANQLR
jgi:hypothetical protein